MFKARVLSWNDMYLSKNEELIFFENGMTKDNMNGKYFEKISFFCC